MKALCLALLATFLCVRAGAELDGLAPQRRAEIERLLADPYAVRNEALAVNRALIDRFNRPDITASLQDAWRQVEQIDYDSQSIGEDLERQIGLKQGQGAFSASVGDELRSCVRNAVSGRRVIIYGYLWPTAVAESFEENGPALPADLQARLQAKIAKSEIVPLSYNGCGATMRGYGIFPLKRPIP